MFVSFVFGQEALGLTILGGFENFWDDFLL